MATSGDNRGGGRNELKSTSRLDDVISRSSAGVCGRAPHKMTAVCYPVNDTLSRRVLIH